MGRYCLAKWRVHVITRFEYHVPSVRSPRSREVNDRNTVITFVTEISPTCILIFPNPLSTSTITVAIPHALPSLFRRDGICIKESS